MSKILRIFLIVVAAAAAAGPAMACCITGQHLDAATAAQHPSCHGASSQHIMTPDTVTPDTPDACPDCYGCDDLATAPGDVASGKALLHTKSAALLPAQQLIGQRISFSAPALKTGPPGTLLPPIDTPIRLKQRLLI